MHLRSASEKQKKIATIITFFTIPLSGFMTDVYLPSFPSMARDLSVSETSIQLTLTCFFLSYGFAQLFVGSILDSLGRYKPLLISLAVLFVSSLAITFTDQVWLISFWRVVQGIGTAFVVVAKRAYFVDVYDAERRKHYLSYFTIVWSCGPIIAPFLGGYLEELFHWQANFYFLAVYAALLFGAEAIFSGETIRVVKKFNLKKTVKLYRVMLRNKAFVLGILILGLAYSVVMVFNIAGPFVVEKHFNFNAVVIGYCTLILGISWMIGGILSKRFNFYSFPIKNKFAVITQLVLISILVILGIYFDTLYLLIAFAFLIHICSGFIFTNYFTNNMIYYPSNAGIAGGLIGGLLYIITSFSSFVISSSGEIIDTKDMALRYLLISIPLAIAIFYALYVQFKRIKRRNLVIG
ncbi:MULTISPECIES: MFS transporter [Mesonia]|uniref:MFS transporter n=1 Tax=Mesonia TaxID=232115 RepID=UPI000C3B9055|nr:MULTISPECIES: MFS transporter [Mesonia]MAN26166.1 MFS transporter [Mesonia sp.]MAQ39534.1 MFS transporter [Mesonia sp.]MBJ96967.1 MFS transporter [Flavobacteriaceae bacterium]|tara:strand:+ start:13758 stop:14981 length:1224 start_codon:yes stop_codon:yes gene_type:complete